MDDVNAVTVESGANPTGGAWVRMLTHTTKTVMRPEEARDAQMSTGFFVRTGPAKDPGNLAIYSLITPAKENPQYSSLKLCPDCQQRSLMRDPEGSSLYCLDCGHNSSDTKKLTPLESGIVQEAMFETLGTGEAVAPTNEARETTPRQPRAFFDSPRSSAALALERKTRPVPSTAKLEKRWALIKMLMEHAAHLIEMGQDMRREHLMELSDQDLTLEAQEVAGGVVWRSYLEIERQGLEVLA